MHDSKKPKIFWIDGWKPVLPGWLSTLRGSYQVETVIPSPENLRLPALWENGLILLNFARAEVAPSEILLRLKQLAPETDVIAVTSEKKVDEAVMVIQKGAIDYLDPEIDRERLLTMIDQTVGAVQRQSALFSPGALRLDEKQFYAGSSAEMKKVMETIDRIGPLPTNILIYGESGTGKEVIAQLIHKKSMVAKQPFVTVNLPSIPANLVESVLFGHEKGSFTSAYRRHYGKFEIADGGTIFLDEIGDLHFDIQSKLLRVIQEGEFERLGGNRTLRVEVRLIAATKTDLKQAVKAGTFRDDLYYRLNVVPMTLPPLRQRKDDIPGLCDIFLKKFAVKFGRNALRVEKDAMRILQAYRWPGNIRELENLMERIVAMVNPEKKSVAIDDIPLEYVYATVSQRTPGAAKLDDALVDYEKALILKALRQNNWNRKRTAQSLGITYGILKYKVRKFKIPIPGQSLHS